MYVPKILMLNNSNSKMIKDKKITQNNSSTNFSIILLVIAVIGVIAMGLYYHYLYLPPLPSPIGKNDQIESSNDTSNSEENTSTSSKTKISNKIIQIPKIIHQMWKDNYNSIPYDMKRWRAGCQQVNSNYEFRFYYDSDLLNFVSKNYPEYLSLFNSLHGVFMADMARILYVYHYGGIYMDLDFYCVKNFDCLIQNIEKQYDLRILKDEFFHYKTSAHILIVPNEPYLQSIMLYLTSRTIIQDWFAATPKHPFFKWILDERNTYFFSKFPHSLQMQVELFKKYNNNSMASITSKSSTTSQHSPVFKLENYYPPTSSIPANLQYQYIPKKPFSNHFDQDLDRYFYIMSYAIKSIKNKYSVTTFGKGSKVISSKVIKLLQPNLQLQLLSNSTSSFNTNSKNNETNKLSLSRNKNFKRKLKIQNKNDRVHVGHYSQIHTTNLSQIPRMGYVIEVSEKELHALIDGTNWRLESFCQAVYHIYDNKNIFNIEKEEYIKYVDNIQKDSSMIHLNDYSNILLKDNNKKEVIQFIHKQHLLHFEKHTDSVNKYEHKANLKLLCNWYKHKKFYHSDKDSTIAVHMWSHTYFNILGWNHLRNYFNKPIYNRIESLSPATMLC